MKIPPVGAQLFRADRRKDRLTDTRKLTDAFRNFANAPNNGTKKTNKCIEFSLYTQ